MKKDFTIYLQRFFILFVLLSSVTIINAQISGTVFKDFNGDGVQQSGEPGKDRIEVYAYSNVALPGKDALVAQTTTDANGHYTINSPTYPVRLEFIIPDGFCNMASDQDYPSANLTAGVNTSEVQIADDGETHNFGIVYPADFSTDDNPRVFVPRYSNGDGLAGGTTSEMPAMVSFHYHDKGVAPNDGRGSGTGDNIPFDTMALYSQLGTVHGVAYSRQAKKVFTSAFLKRHAGLGPLGGGGIYWLDPEPPYDLNANLEFMDFDELGIPTSDETSPFTDNPPGSSALKVMFSPVIGTNAERGLPAEKTSPSHDRVAYSQIGKLSFGDLEISEDGRYLYVVNLYDRKLYEIDLTDPDHPVAPTVANASQKIHGYQIPDPCSDPENGEYRPFALKITRGKVYVGVTCSGQDADGNTVASNNSFVTSSVFEFDMSTHTFDTAPILSFDYSYRNNDKPWNAWTNEWVGNWEKGYPLLSDIDIDNNGNILLGIKDMRGDQLGHQNYTIDPNSTSLSSMATVGELLNAVRDASSPTCSYNIQLTPEFYNDNLIHSESSQGALAVHHTSNFDGALSTFLDPVPGHVWAGGALLYNNQDGSQQYGQGYEIFFSSNNGLFGKANGLGDLETMEVIPPIEIGNIVWLDKDKDGIQDADEEGIPGVIVELVKNGQVVSTTTTDAMGTYYFNFTNTNNGEGPEPNTNYTIRISSTQFLNGVGSGPLALKSLTLTDEAGNGENDWSDNDASDVGGVIQFDITTGNPGQNNHSYDFGFYPKAEIGNYVWEDMDANGIQDDGDTGINGIEVKLYDGNGSYLTSMLTTNDPSTGAPGYYLFTNLEPGDYYVCFTKGAYGFSPKDSGGDDSIDSDADEITGCAEATTLVPGESDMSWDAGLFQLASLGDYVWMDKDEDGIQDIDENPLKNVIVNLYEDNDADGNPDGPAIAQTITDNNGFYEFTDLRPGNYIVGFERPPGYKTVPQNQGGDDAKDSDYDETTLLTGTINLESGENDPTIDAGFKVRFDLALKKYKPATPAKQGENITFDIEIFNQSEIGADVKDVEVTDYINLAAYDFNPALNPGWTLTGNKAKYVYSNTLSAQTSDIIQITLTVKYGATEANLKNEAEISGFKDMDGEPQTEEKDSYPDDDPDNDNDVECGSADDDYIDGNVKENPGDDEDDNDVACVDIFDLALTKIETSTGPYKFGDDVTFTYTIYNQGNIAATNIEVTDYVPSGFEYDPAMNAAWTQTVSSTPKTTITTVLNPGEQTTVTLILKAQYTADYENGWTNVAEISKGEDIYGNDWSNYDWDSTLDDDPGNDAGGKADSPNDNFVDGNGTGVQGDSSPSTDEDDADPARIKIYDLALRKTLLTQPPYQYYDDLTFEITVFNQGNETMTDIEVSDYIPEGFAFDSGMNTGWNGAAPTVTTVIPDPLAPGDSAKVQIVLKLVQTDGGEINWDNYAEITGMKDSQGAVADTWDADSTPGSDAGYERAVKPGDSDDDNIDGHYIPDGTDEDDHDPAGVPVFDLAMKKVETSAGPYRYGDQVTFTYTVYNQGNIDAQNIEVTDYVPSGFEYDPGLNGNWTQGQVNTPATIIPSLAAGSETTVTLVLIAQPTNDVVDGWTNKAEISRAEDPAGTDMSNEDIDSDLDNDQYNDIGGTPDTDEDNEVGDDGKDGDGNGITDEDDADPARVKVYDLALRKTVVTPEPYQYYDDLTFEITVFNQGNETMTEIEVSDYIPEGFSFDSGMNTGWNGAAPTVTTVIPDPLAPGDSAKVQIVLKLVQTNGGELLWDNYAEITGMKDDQGAVADTWDADSNPDSDATHERAVKPEDPDDDNIDGHYIPDGTDEDDHDPAGIHVLDLALTKTTDAVPPFTYDQIVDFTFTIYNQGNEIAHDIDVMDYVPDGFIYLPHINTEWTQALVDNPSTIITTPLLPGESTTVTIKLQFQYTPVVNGYMNKAEIVNAKDENDEPFDDIDSTPDDDPDNDIGGTPLSPEDDNVSDDGKDGDGDGITDEDDEDPWNIEVASIGNYVWYDDNDNGLQDDGMPSAVGVEDVTVILEDCNGKEILRTTTDENGHYDFPNLIPGNYLVVFDDLPENSLWAKQNQGGNDALDSDADENGIATCVNLEAGEDDPTWDAGILRLSSLGDYVWLDTDADGVQDAEESAISGVVVKLLDEQGNVLETTTTNEEGYYIFDSLRPGTYVVQFENPGGLEYSPVGQGGDTEKDSDADPANDGKTEDIVLGADEDKNDIDAGFTCTLSVDVSQNVTICEGETVDIAVTTTGGQVPMTVIWTTGETTETISVTPSVTTIYGVTVTDKYGCEDSGEVTVTVEPKAKIGDYVWYDLDRDGIQDFYIQDPDLDEPGINGVTVNLYKEDDPNTVYMTQVTHTNADTSGYYEFEVCAGDYFVEFIPPVGQGLIFTQQDQGVDDVFDSDADETTGRTIATHLDPAEVDHTWDAGFYTTASIGDYVWHDNDADGIQDSGEEGIDGVTVTLHRADGSVVGTTTTANGGKYEFTGLLPDDYYVCFDYSGTVYTQISPRDQGYDNTVDSDVDPASGCTEITGILAGENDMTWDMGLYTLASLGDYVWYDKDGDGCQDADEEGIEGVAVHLYADADANGVPDGPELSNTQTDNTGFYEFTGLAAGTYIVKFDKPNSDYKVSPKNHNGAEGCDDASDSDGDAIFGYSDPVPLADNQHDPTIDQGYYESARLGDYVWFDKNGDGIQDASEPGVPGVTVTLIKDTDGDGVPETPVDTKVTDTDGESGKYTFEDVDPGLYKICFDAGDDYDGFTKSNEGTDSEDSDADSQTGCTEVFVVESGDNDMMYDAGLIKLAELGDYVWEDDNADGYQDPTELPIEGVMVVLQDGAGNPLDTTYTDASGLYKFEDLLPGDYIVHFEKPDGFESTDKDAIASDSEDSDADIVSGDSHLVTLEAGDSDMTIDAGYYRPANFGDYVWEDKDANGIQDLGEEGVNGVAVTLNDENGNPLENTTTGVNPETGENGFYEFDELKPGVYYVCFDKGSWDKFAPEDKESDDTKDSDADPVSGCTEMTILTSGENDPNWDAGVYDYASLGDYVWLDDNADGVQDAGESGINDMEVVLYADTDGDCNPDGDPVATTTTASHLGNDGYYIFENLEPGDYVVFFAPSDTYDRTDSQVGTDSEDSDADIVTGLSDCINLESGEHDPTIDAGYFYASGLGDYTWYDEDGDGIQDETEKCMDSVKIVLYKVDEIAPGVLDTVKVDSTYSHAVLDGQDTVKCGFYEFTRLKPGDYFLTFENPDNTKYNISPKDKLYDDAKDNDIDDDGNTATVTLDPGEYDSTIDAGFYEGDCIEGVVWKDRPEGYQETGPNGEILLSYVDVLDNLDIMLEGIEVRMYSDPNSHDASDDVLYRTTFTNSFGSYYFDNVKIGSYYLVLVLPDTLETVNNDIGGDDYKDNDFYLSDVTGMYRSQTFVMEADNDEACMTSIKGGTRNKVVTQALDLLAYEVNWNKNEESVDIVWNTMNEVNVDYYTLERRPEGSDRFVEIANINAKGQRGMNNYGVKDPNVEGGNRYYYRLTAYDVDGLISGVYIDNVLIPASKFTVQAYPNPVQDKLYIILSGKRSEKTTIEILDGLGRKALKTIKLEDNRNEYEKIRVKMGNLPLGQYYIKVISGERVEFKKILHVK